MYASGILVSRNLMENGNIYRVKKAILGFKCSVTLLIGNCCDIIHIGSNN